MRIIAYAYDADLHCVDCARRAFASTDADYIPDDAKDSEGNPINPVFDIHETAEGEYCADCKIELKG